MSERLERAVADMVAGVKNRDKAAFALPESRFLKHKRRRDERASRRGVRRLIRPENSHALLDALPAPDEILHAVLRGDFVMGDCLAPLLARRGHCEHLRVSTLGLSTTNAESLRDLIRGGAIARCTLLVSTYFQAVDKTSTFLAVSKILRDIATVKVARCHAKILLIPTARGDAFVFEGSANLRSSDTIEQLTVFNDPELLAFHAAWMDAIPA